MNLVEVSIGELSLVGFSRAEGGHVAQAFEAELGRVMSGDLSLSASSEYLRREVPYEQGRLGDLGRNAAHEVFKAVQGV